jgi:hypothetical protein
MRTERPLAAPDLQGIERRLERTISSERQLLMHPLYGVGAARVMVRARAEIRRIRRIRASSR